MTLSLILIHFNVLNNIQKYNNFMHNNHDYSYKNDYAIK